MIGTKKELSIALEHFETPRWAVDAILKKEILNRIVVDPCCGTGVLSESAKDSGYSTVPYDIYDWGYEGTIIQDFLEAKADDYSDAPFTILMNPPFSKAEEFVRKAFEIGARKVVCFQRFAWFESRSRRNFWKEIPPQRIYICGDRANCWRHDIPLDGRGSTSPTAHAWFVWEKGQHTATILNSIWKDES